MKTFTKILALSLVVILSVMVLASCAVPAKDPKDAKKALEDNGYQATLIDDKKLLDDDVEAQIMAYNDDEEYIIIVWYKDKNFIAARSLTSSATSYKALILEVTYCSCFKTSSKISNGVLPSKIGLGGESVS